MAAETRLGGRVSPLFGTSAAKIGCQQAQRRQNLPAASTRRVPVKLNRIIFLHRRESSINSTRLRMSSPMSTPPANSLRDIGPRAYRNRYIHNRQRWGVVYPLATVCPSARLPKTTEIHAPARGRDRFFLPSEIP